MPRTYDPASSTGGSKPYLVAHTPADVTTYTCSQQGTFFMPRHYSVHHEVGDCNRFAFVLSCPGRLEAEADPPRPAQGQTGENLARLVAALPADTPHLQSLQRGHTHIANAWPHVEHNALTGRTEPMRREVLGDANLARLACELSDIEVAVICCGKLAALAVHCLASGGRLPQGVDVAFLPHLGTRGINSTASKDDCDRNVPGSPGETKSQASSRRQAVRIARVAVHLRQQAPRLNP